MRTKSAPEKGAVWSINDEERVSICFILLSSDSAGSMPADTHLFQVFLKMYSANISAVLLFHSFFCPVLAPNILLYGQVFVSAIRGCGQSFPSPCDNNVFESLYACPLQFMLIGVDQSRPIINQSVWSSDFRFIL